MGTLSGRMLAERILGQDPVHCPQAMSLPLARFPLGALRRLLMPPLYAWLKVQDR
jgi:glycine/D-amino acid oxidase-like deaminating enzyme